MARRGARGFNQWSNDMHLRNLSAAAIALAFFLGGSIARAAPPGTLPQAMGAETLSASSPATWLQRFGDELSLTPAQRQTIRGLLDSARPNLEAARRQLTESLEMLRVTNPDHPQYERVVGQVSQVVGELSARMVNDLSQLRAQAWAVLTDEQRIRLTHLEDQHREKMLKRWRTRAAGPASSQPAQ
jgi:Spy/CpxP family protein refolding chaperone